MTVPGAPGDLQTDPGPPAGGRKKGESGGSVPLRYEDKKGKTADGEDALEAGNGGDR
jgi:hypothetical protein